MARKPMRSARVLVVDEDSHARKLLIELLREAGVEASGCGSAADALAAAFVEPPELVITDVASGGIDGFTLAHELRTDRRTQDVPVIALTSGWTASIRARASRAGIGVLLLKPCAREHLLGEVARALQNGDSGADAPRSINADEPSERRFGSR
jgi:CheY-like chemotaxis protein